MRNLNTLRLIPYTTIGDQAEAVITFALDDRENDRQVMNNLIELFRDQQVSDETLLIILNVLAQKSPRPPILDTLLLEVTKIRRSSMAQSLPGKVLGQLSDSNASPSASTIASTTKKTDNKVSRPAKLALSAIGTAQNNQFLLTALNDSDPKTREKAITSLCQSIGNSILPETINALQDRAIRVRSAAANCLNTWVKLAS